MTRRRVILAGVIVLALAGSFATGRFTARPAAVHDETHATTASQSSASSAKVAHVEAIAHESATGDVDTKTTTARRWVPAAHARGGCPDVPAHVEEVITTETHAATTRTADARRASSVAAKQEQQASAQQTTVTLHTIEARPTWSVSLLAGGQLGGRRLLDALPAPLVVGVVLERRILGPVSVGLWGTTGLAAGLTVRADF